MKEVKVKLYHFDELSEDAQHNVCERDREETYGWAYICQEQDASERRATLDKFCEVFGIKYDIDYNHQYRFISWHFEDSELEANSEELCGKYLWRFLNKYYYDIRNRKYYGKLIPHEKDPEHPAGFEHVKRYSKIWWVEQECPFTGMCYDCDILDKIFDWYKKPDWNLSLHDLFDDCFSYYMKLWSDEDDYRTSDESIGDMIQANWSDKLYYEDGTEFNGIYEEAA